MSWGFNSYSPHGPHSNCELGFFWDAVKRKCRKRVLHINLSVPESLPEVPHEHGLSDYFSFSGFFFTVLYIAAILFVIKLYFQYLFCGWRRRASVSHGSSADMNRRRFADASRLRCHGQSVSRFHVGHSADMTRDFVIPIPSNYSETGSLRQSKPQDQPPSYEEATKGS